MANLDNEFFSELTKDTAFVSADSGSLMTNRLRVPTPLYALNCIYGGGLPLSIMSQISGCPASGKSTFSYQCLGNYQKEYEHGVGVIFDQESSTDNDRLRMLGVDPSKVLRLPSTSLEESFANMFKMMNNIVKMQERIPDISAFMIYDTLSAGGTNKQHVATESGASAFNAGSMMEAPRVIKQNLANIFPYIEKFPVFIGFLNQVFTQIGTYVSKVDAPQQLGLNHNIHCHIKFGSNKDVFENGWLVGTESMVQLGKSKLSPKLSDIPCYIDATAGGRIDEVDSFVRYLTRDNIGIIKTGSYYSIKEAIDWMTEKHPVLKDNKNLMFYYKSIRRADLFHAIHEDYDLLQFLQVALMEVIGKVYPLQMDVMRSYYEKCMSECSWLKDSDPSTSNTEDTDESISVDESEDDAE